MRWSAATPTRVGVWCFLPTDPIPGGSANNYDYANQDPINQVDLASTDACWLPWVHCAKGGKKNVRDSGLRDLTDDEVQDLVVNRCRTMAIHASAIQQLQVRRVGLGQGPFAVAVRCRTESGLRRLFRGVRIEATASYSRSVNTSIAALEHLYGTGRHGG